jgi:endonuclease G
MGFISAKRPTNYNLDPELSQSCQQYSSESYQNIHPDYNRGHLVTSGHMSFNGDFRKRANYMVFISF